MISEKYVHWIISYDSNVLVLIEMKLKSQIQMLKNIHTDVSLIKEKKKIIATMQCTKGILILIPYEPS